MSKDPKKLFSSIAKTTVGAVAGAALILTPASAFAGDGHDHGTESGDHGCGGEKGCGGDKGCSGETDESGDKSCSGETDESGDKSCSGEMDESADKEEGAEHE